MSCVSLNFNSCHLKQLKSQSKFSGTRKFTLKYQKFEKNFDFEISRVACTVHWHLFEFTASVLVTNLVMSGCD